MPVSAGPLVSRAICSAGPWMRRVTAALSRISASASALTWWSCSALSRSRFAARSGQQDHRRGIARLRGEDQVEQDRRYGSQRSPQATLLAVTQSAMNTVIALMNGTPKWP